MLDRQLDGALGTGDAHDADGQTLTGEHIHQLEEALAFDTPDQVLGGHARILQEDFGGVQGVLADLVDDLGHLEARALVLFHHEQ
ncbi:hypothetical protein D9M68_818520 [compost metagenome]